LSSPSVSADSVINAAATPIRSKILDDCIDTSVMMSWFTSMNPTQVPNELTSSDSVSLGEDRDYGDRASEHSETGDEGIVNSIEFDEVVPGNNETLGEEDHQDNDEEISDETSEIAVGNGPQCRWGVCEEIKDTNRELYVS
jgi:hypothetical protein